MIPYDWQELDIRATLDNNLNGLLAVEAGGGKTLIAASALARSGAETNLIIAPLSTIETPKSAWPKTLNSLGVETRRIGNSTKSLKDALLDLQLGVPGTYLMTPQLFTRMDVSLLQGDVLITDESHMLTTAKTKGQQKWSGYDLRSDNPINTRFESRLALSGTFMRQNFSNAWATMRYLWPELSKRDQVAYANYYMWQQDRMESIVVPVKSEWKPIGKYTVVPPGAKTRNINGFPEYLDVKKVTQFTAESQPGLLFSQLPFVVQHKRRDNCCAFHPTGFLSTEAPQVIDVYVDLTAKQRKQIHELETMLMTWIEGQQLIVDLTMTQKQRIRQLCLGEAYVDEYQGVSRDGDPVEKTRLEFNPECESPFIDATLDILDSLPNDEPVLITMESQRFVEVVVHQLRKRGFKAEEYSGVRKADLYQLGSGYQILVASISSMGTGTDGLQDRCKTEIRLETPISWTNEEQLNARLDRIGGQQVQRYRVMDTTGYAEGRYSDLLTKALQVKASTTL